MYSLSSELPGHSRIWIYQSSRPLTGQEENLIGEDTRQFLENWTAHNQALKASYEIRHHRFLILMIDEKIAGAGGCSIDKSVHFIKNLEKKYGITLLDRMNFAYLLNDRVETVSAGGFRELYERGVITPESRVFNNLIGTKSELETGWLVPLKESWHRNFIPA